MLEILLIIMISCMVTGLLCYTAGVFTGKAIERKRIVTIIDRYYKEDSDANLY